MGWDVDFEDASGELPWSQLDGMGKVKRVSAILAKITVIVGALYLFIWYAQPRVTFPMLHVSSCKPHMPARAAAAASPGWLMASVSWPASKREKSSATPKSSTTLLPACSSVCL